MHSAALYLAPILGAEKSRVPFYVAGGALVAWALIVSVGLGLRRPDFPGNMAGQRVVLAISAVLVLGAVSTAVITSGVPAKAGAAGGPSSSAAAPSASTPSASTPTSSTPTSSTRTASTPAASTPAKAPKATTGTPAPPSSPAASKGPSALKLAANTSGLLSYDTKQLSAKAGTVTITLTNMAPLEHDVTIAEGSAVLGATPVFAGGSHTLKLTLKPGTYTFYCSVPGHRQAGMEGTLSVA